MRVLQVGKFYPPDKGGIETVLEAISESLAERADVQVLVAHRGIRTKQETVGGVKVTRVGSLGSLASTSVCPTFPFWLRRLAGDVVHLHESNPLATLSYLVAGIRGRLIVSFHSEIIRQHRLVRGYEPFRRRLLERADRILVATPEHLRTSPSLKPFLEKCAVVPFGIDLDRFRERSEVKVRAAALREQFGSPLILFVGRLVYYKGVDVLIDAMTGIPATLLIAGDGPMRWKWEEAARHLNGSTSIRFLGEVSEPDLAALYHASEMLVLPSTQASEAFGLVQLEAMACRRPIISTRLESGVSWVNRHGESGLVIEPNDSSALSRSIRQLIADPECCRRMGENGFARVQREFDRSLMGERLYAIYQEVMTLPQPD